MTKSCLDVLPGWLRPLPVRIALVGLVGGWGAFEAWLGNVVWAGLFLACGAYGVWELIVKPARSAGNTGDP
jgi:hypothetical protein